MEWAAEEMKQVNLGDKRLDIRAVNLLNKLGNKPLETIPMACQGWAEKKAAYRFFDNGNVTEEKILAPHIEATISRMELYSTVLLILSCAPSVSGFLDNPLGTKRYCRVIR
jgi:hypothetical protein